jgi:hypothetical protein
VLYSTTVALTRLSSTYNVVDTSSLYEVSLLVTSVLLDNSSVYNSVRELNIVCAYYDCCDVTRQQASQAYTSSKARLQRKLQRSNLTAFCLGDESSARSTEAAAATSSSRGHRADDAMDNSDLLHSKEHRSSEPESIISVSTYICFLYLALQWPLLLLLVAAISICLLE